MSNNSIQHIRGTLAEHSTYTGRKGEISLITDSTNDRVPTGEIRIHDGATASGVPIKLGTSSSPLTSDIYLASGSGINFSAYATSGNPSSNLLDDYEEGTWTPISNAGTLTVVDTPTYTKIGRHVFLTAVFTMPTQTNSSQARVSGLPFTAKDNGSNSEYGAAIGETNYGSYIVLCINADNSAILFRPNAGSSTTYTNVSGKNFRFTISYLTDS